MIQPDIRSVCVIGAGTMGGGIAAHLANLGFNVTLLDVTQQDAVAGLERTRLARPPAFYVPERAGEIRTGNTVEHLYWAGEAEWVIEAIVEDVAAKRTLFARLEPLLQPDAVVSSNTSGIQLASLAEGMTPGFQCRFLGIHFFNPPRYLKLVELIPTANTDPFLLEWIVPFLEERVARRVVVAKDTPGFIANRFGMWSLYHSIRVAEKLGFAIEDVDAITGSFLGRPKTATFRLADVIGLDVMRDIGSHLRQSLPADPQVEAFELPASMLSLLARNWIGDKAGHGYYRREGRELLALDLGTFAYRMAREPGFADLAALAPLPLQERLRQALLLRSEVGEFLREYLAPCLRYADALKTEISHSVYDFDNVMKWGFGWELGPFELIDLLGPTCVGLPVSDHYYQEGKVKQFTGGYKLLPSRAEYKPLEEYKQIAAGETFKLRDLGDGVIAVVLTTKMGVITPELVRELTFVFSEPISHYVLTSEAKSFSAGYDLNFFRTAIASGDLDLVENELLALQKLGELMEKRSGAAAVFGHCLGAGLELALSAPIIVAAAETQIGLPETKVGLIPGGRGVTLMRQYNSFNAKRLAEVTVTMAQGTIAASADNARVLGYLRATDKTAYNPDSLIFVAKQAALEAKPQPLDVWTATLGPLVGMIDRQMAELRTSGAMSEYDEIVGGKIRQIVARSTSYEDALTRERLEFVDLCGRALTQARIRHMLENGKPLRN